MSGITSLNHSKPGKGDNGSNWFQAINVEENMATEVDSPKKPGPKTKRVQAAVHDFDQRAIRRIIQTLYVNKSWSTVKKIYSEIRHQLGFASSKSTLRRILKVGLQIR